MKPPEATRRILLVDDNPTNLKVLNETLKGRGYEIRIARSGEQALQLAARRPPDLVLLDIMMPPGIDGYETLRRLRERPETEQTPVVFLSALDETRDKVKGLALGAVDYVSKPFQADEVIARVDTHLTVHLLRREVERRNRELEAANERMKRDLEAAAKVQQAMLPRPFPEDERVRVAWRYQPCDELGGDSLNVHRVGADQIALFVLDVSGHGVPAALMSVSVTRDLEPSKDRSGVTTDLDGRASNPAKVVRRLNALYPWETNGGLYFTMIYGVLDLDSGRFRFVCAGHPGPIVVRAAGGAEQIKAPSIPVGVREEIEFAESGIELAAGDRLYLFSDGLFEQPNPEREAYGLERLIDGLADRSAEPLEGSLDAVRRDLAAWQGDGRLDDDFSIVGLELLRR